MALTEIRPDLLVADGPTRQRWFAMVALLSKSARATMLRSLRDTLLAGADVAELDNLIDAGGDMLMTVGKFGDEPDRTARHIILPLVSQESGRAVLRPHGPFFQSVVTNSESDTKATILEALEAAAEADENQREEIKELKRTLGIGR